MASSSTSSSSCSHPPFLLILSLSIISAVGQGTVHVIDGLPCDASPVDLLCQTGMVDRKACKLRCSDGGFRWCPRRNYRCMAVWGELSASMVGYTVSNPVYWLLKEDGIYVSSDNCTWVMDGPWDED